MKQAKERSEENLVQQLEKELQEAKEISIESIADTIDDGCDDGNRTLLENRIFKSKVVQEQLLDFSNLKEKLQHAIDTRLAGDGVAEKTIEVNLAKAKDAIGCSTMTSAGMSVYESVIQIPVVWNWSTILTASLQARSILIQRKKKQKGKIVMGKLFMLRKKWQRRNRNQKTAWANEQEENLLGNRGSLKVAQQGRWTN